jgi:hypothetical protein
MCEPIRPSNITVFELQPTEPTMKLSLLISLLVLPLATSFVSCKPKGAAEKAGEGIDKAVESVKDAVDPKGPVEKAGEKIDKALSQ